MKSFFTLTVLCSTALVVSPAAQGSRTTRSKGTAPRAGDLPDVMTRTARGVSIDDVRNRAKRLGDAGFYFASLHDRVEALNYRGVTAYDLELAGEGALALNRFEPLVILAPSLERRGATVAKSPAGYRAALAAYEFRLGKVARAAEMMPDSGTLARIPNAAARSRALMTAAAIKAAQERLPEAIEILDIAAQGGGDDPTLARLQKARLLYEVGRYGSALDELGFVPKSSPHWYDGVQVAAWSAYKLRDDNLTLGQTLTLNSPHLAAKFNPESYSLEAASLYRLCQYESAQRSLSHLRGKYGKFSQVIERFRRAYGEHFTGVSELLKYARGKESPANGFSDSEWSMLADGLLSQEGMSEADRMLIQIQREEEGVDAAVPVSSGSKFLYKLRADYRADLESAKREAYTVGLRAMRRKIAEMQQDLSRNLEGALAIEVEINTRIRERLMSGAVARPKAINFEAEVKKGYEFWPFEGEYWRDELGGYAFATSDVCAGHPGTDL